MRLMRLLTQSSEVTPGARGESRTEPDRARSASTPVSAIAALRHEHGRIVDVLDATDDLARRISQGEAADPEVAAALWDFLYRMGHRTHCVKEEEVLFPLLARRGLDPMRGPLAGLPEDHRRQHAWLLSMGERVAAWRAGEAGAARAWAAAARPLAAQMKLHVSKEDAVVLRLAERLLTPDDQEALGEACARIERERIPPQVAARLWATAEAVPARVFAAGGAAGAPGR